MSEPSSLRAMGLQLIAMADAMQDREPAIRFSLARQKISPSELASECASMYATRRQRDKLLPAEMFGEPAWDMLLELFRCSLQGSELPITSLCIASGVPQTTALRYLELLLGNGLILRRRSDHDKRVGYVRLSKEGYGMMSSIVSSSIDRTRNYIAPPADDYLRPTKQPVEPRFG